MAGEETVAEVGVMVTRRLWQAGASVLAGILLVAVVSYVSAQGGSVALALIGEGQAGGAVTVAAGGVSEGSSSLELAEAESTTTVTIVAQTPPPVVTTPSTVEEAVITMPTNWLSERVWTDGARTVVECIGSPTRTCNVNVYGPAGEHLLGWNISPTGLGTDCSGPCLDSTGTVLDSSSISRAQSAIAAGNRSYSIVSATPVPAQQTTQELLPEEPETAEPVIEHGE